MVVLRFFLSVSKASAFFCFSASYAFLWSVVRFFCGPFCLFLPFLGFRRQAVLYGFRDLNTVSLFSDWAVDRLVWALLWFQPVSLGCLVLIVFPSAVVVLGLVWFLSDPLILLEILSITYLRIGYGPKPF